MVLARSTNWLRTNHRTRGLCISLRIRMLQNHTMTRSSSILLLLSMWLSLACFGARAQEIRTRPSRTETDRISSDLHEYLRGPATNRAQDVRVIVQLNSPIGGRLSALLGTQGVRLRNHFKQL